MIPTRRDVTRLTAIAALLKAGLDEPTVRRLLHIPDSTFHRDMKELARVKEKAREYAAQR